MRFPGAAIIVALVLGFLAKSLPATAMDHATGDHAMPAVASLRMQKHASVLLPVDRMAVTEQPNSVSFRNVFSSVISSRLPDGNVEFCSGPGHQ